LPEGKTPEAFIKYLDQTFVDPDDAERAREQLRGVFQGRDEPFSSFITRFELVLSRCYLEQDGKSDASNIAWLKSSLNQKLAEAMVHHPAGEDYGEYKQLLLTISSRLEGVRLHQVPGFSALRPANHALSR
ncbi:hypothetical protein SEPCBS119000_006779, partial [Sporothrix epigloea]